MQNDRREFLQTAAALGAAAVGASAVARAAKTESGGYENYKTLKVDIKDQVATVTVANGETLPKPGERRPDSHWELAQVFSELRYDNRVRVIVLTGPGNGIFHATPRNPDGTPVRYHIDEWLTFNGARRVHQEMAESEKIIVGKVNGDAVGFGSSIVFSCDLVVAREDAIVSDLHLSMGELDKYGGDVGLVPGDGGCALLPLFMSPMKAKEYLLLSKPYTAGDLARMGIINYAVPAAQLDSAVDELVIRLLKRSAYGLAWAKRVANRRVVQHLNMTLDAAAAYEQVTMLQLEKRGWKENTSFL